MDLPEDAPEEQAMSVMVAQVMKKAVSVIEKENKKPTLKKCLEMVVQHGRTWLSDYLKDVAFIEFSEAGWKKIVKQQVAITGSKRMERTIVQCLEDISAFQPEGATVDDLWSFFQATTLGMSATVEDELVRSLKMKFDCGIDTLNSWGKIVSRDGFFTISGFSSAEAAAPEVFQAAQQTAAELMATRTGKRDSTSSDNPPSKRRQVGDAVASSVEEGNVSSLDPPVPISQKTCWDAAAIIAYNGLPPLQPNWSKLLHRQASSGNVTKAEDDAVIPQPSWQPATTAPVRVAKVRGRLLARQFWQALEEARAAKLVTGEVYQAVWQFVTRTCGAHELAQCKDSLVAKRKQTKEFVRQLAAFAEGGGMEWTATKRAVVYLVWTKEVLQVVLDAQVMLDENAKKTLKQKAEESVLQWWKTTAAPKKECATLNDQLKNKLPKKAKGGKAKRCRYPSKRSHPIDYLP